MPATNRPTQQDRYRKIVAAIPKYFTNVVSLILAGPKLMRLGCRILDCRNYRASI